MITSESNCEYCSNGSFIIIETIRGEEGKVYNIDMHNDGTLMIHVYNQNGSKQGGSRIGQLKYCPKCGKEFK